MTRTYLVTGSASGIGKATVERLRSDGHRVIGVDLRNADIEVDLSTQDGRAALVEQARELSGGVIDGVLAVAGVLVSAAPSVAVNHFGAVATLEGLRPLLAAAEQPRAAVVATRAIIDQHDEKLVELIESGDEPSALAYADSLSAGADAIGGSVIYATSKYSLARWVRKNASTDSWAGSGIALNAVAPGVIISPMTIPILASEEGRASLNEHAPAPFGGPGAEPLAVANLLAWLTSPDNLFVTGQIIFIDGGAESIRRPEFI